MKEKPVVGQELWSLLYMTEKEYQDEQEAKSLRADIVRAFGFGRNKEKVSLEDLRKIHAIISPPGEER